MNTKEVYHAFVVLLFVIFSSYLTIQVNYQDNNYYYFFFKARNYYSTIEKFIIPILFWASAFIFLIVPNIFKLIRYPGFNLLLVIRNSFLLNIFLISICFSNEYLQDNFSLTSISGNSFPNIWIYQGVALSIFFIIYYITVIEKTITYLKAKDNLVNLIFPFSIPIPFIFFGLATIHLSFLGLALLIRWYKRKFISYKILDLPWLVSVYIFLIAVSFRLIYAWYFSLFGFDSIGFGADGPSYFRSAIAFSDFNVKNIDFSHTPAYSFYLSIFISLLDATPKTIFYGQAVIGSFVPVIIYFITNKIFGSKVSFISGVLVAVSNLCIHYSVVINRASLIAFTIPVLILFCLKVNDIFKNSSFFIFGFLIGTTYYIGQESLLLLLFLLGYFFMITNNNFSIKKKALGFSLCFLGLAVAWTPINYAYYKATGDLILSGRYVDFSADTFSFNGNPFSKEMIQLGFDPVSTPINSFKSILAKPFDIIFLSFGKLLSELPGFLLDPGGEWLKPLGLLNGSFFDAVISFYIHCFIIFGIFYLIFENATLLKHKLLIIMPVLFYAVFSTFMIMGTFRFRSVMSPLNQIFLAIAVGRLIGIERQTLINETRELSGVFNKKLNYLRRQWIPYFEPSFAILLLIFGVLVQKEVKTFNLKKSLLEITNWQSNLSNEQLALKQGTVKNIQLRMNYHNKSLENIDNRFILSFNLCRYLFPNIQPEYQIILDKTPISTPRKIPQGCHRFLEKIKPLKNEGTIEIAILKASSKNRPVSDTFKTDEPRMWFITNLFFDKVFKKYQLFLKELTLLKIGKPVIFKLKFET
tara:strand:+ start:8793 stop:11222 length:2430 start_codon:yes stop_codon:yes gene_type:complete